MTIETKPSTESARRIVTIQRLLSGSLEPWVRLSLTTEQERVWSDFHPGQPYEEVERLSRY